MAYFVLIVFLLYQAMLLLHAGQLTQLSDAYDAKNRAAAVQTVSASVFNYYRENGTYPASLTALAVTPGQEQIRSALLPWQGFATTTNLNDGVWRYSRVAVYTQDPYDHPLTDAENFAAANNACGTLDFATAPDWCGRTTSLWYRHETREDAIQTLARERKRQKRLLDKFASYYNKNIPDMPGHQTFPNPGSAAAQLKTLTAYAGTAKTCTGVYQWNGIPIDCNDLYSQWGTPTVYNYLTASHISLLTQSPFTDNTGAPIYVSTDLSL